MKKIMLIMIVAIVTLFTGCASAPKVNANQRSKMRTRTVEADYKTVFKSAMIVLENNGYTIDNTDMDSGLIKASISKDATSGFAKAFGSYGIITYDVSSTVTSLNKENTRIRFNIRKEEDRQQGVYNMKDAEEIDDPAVYQTLFNDLRLEVERMKAMS